MTSPLLCCEIKRVYIQCNLKNIVIRTFNLGSPKTIMRNGGMKEKSGMEES